MGVAVDAAGGVYIADTGNHRIRQVKPNGVITTVAGDASEDGGQATQARLHGPRGMAVDMAGALYIADQHSERVRRVERDGTITAVAGTGMFGFSGDGGRATEARLNSPVGVASGGVDDGVRRYDGVKWTAYTPKDGLYGAPVYALCATQDGSLYAGTDTGISRFREGKWNRVFPPDGDLPWSINKLMEARDGSVWAGTMWGALRLGQEGVTLYTTEQMRSALRTLAPDVRLSIVPDAAAPAYLYGEGIGAMVVGTVRRHLAVGSASVAICALAHDGPGEAAGLKVGDRITAVDGQLGVSQLQLNGPAGASMKLTVQ
jgi:ligand-binding sensor domain-containing protein